MKLSRLYDGLLPLMRDMVIVNRLPETRSGKNPAKETDALQMETSSVHQQSMTKPLWYDNPVLQNMKSAF
jgi:hypothetical protein